MTNMQNDIEKLRQSFRPEDIKALFVGESAPAGDTFFYRGNSQMFRYVKRSFGDPPNFLDWFRDKGWYLDDLVLTPVNRYTNAKRKDMHAASLPDFSKRLQTYSPQCVVSLLRGIREPVQKAIEDAGLNIPHYSVPFPGNGQQGRFMEAMKQIIPKLAQ